MAEGTPLSLARALRFKNRLVSRMTQVWADIALYNSTPQGTEPVVDVRALYVLHWKLHSLLVQLKTSIQIGTQKIQGKLVELSEKKSAIKQHRSLSTKTGKQINEQYYRQGVAIEPLAYTAVVSKAEVDAVIGQLEREIDVLQEQIDQHNTSTQISVPPELLADGILTSSALAKK